MSTYRTEQEKFWAGEFGNEYIERNDTEEILATKTAFYSKVLSFTEGISKQKKSSAPLHPFFVTTPGE